MPIPTVYPDQNSNIGHWYAYAGLTPSRHHQSRSYDPNWLLNNHSQCARWRKETFWHATALLFGEKVYAGYAVSDHRLLFGARVDGFDFYFWDKDLDTIMQQWGLYEHEGFWQCIKEFPRYGERITKVYEQIGGNHAMRKKISQSAYNRLQTEHQRIEEQEQKRERQQRYEAAKQQKEYECQESAFRQRVSTTFSEQQANLDEIVLEYDRLIAEETIESFGNRKRLSERIAAIKEIQESGVCYSTRRYVLNGNVEGILPALSLDAEVYKFCYGNQLQQLIHQDCVALLEEVTNTSLAPVVPEYKSVLVDCVDAAREYNQAGYCRQAITVTDFCWSLLSYGKAVIEGAAQGAIDVAQDFYKHPILTTACVVFAPMALAYQLSKVVYSVADIGFTYARDAERGAEKWHECIAPITSLITAIEQKQIGGTDVVREATRFAVRWRAQNKLLGGLNKLCAIAKSKALEFFKNNPLAFPEQYLTTPEGILIRAINKLPNKQDGFNKMEGRPKGTKPKREKYPPIPTEGPLQFFTQNTIEDAVQHVMKNKNRIKHIFEPTKHKLDCLVRELGSEESVVREALKALSGKVHFNEKFENLAVQIASYEVYVRGRVMNGMPKLATFFIK